MVGMNQNSYMDHENERMDLILFSDSRKKKKKIPFNSGKICFFMIKNLSISSSLIPDKQRGSVESQVFYLTNRVLRLTQHLQLHAKDYSSQRGLWKILGKRKQLLVYLYKRDKLRYDDLIGRLGIRGLKTR
jgi:small subunit ribosomal protein S15|uniref:30S ribosomal protein S15 n=3 Tax=Abies TaxID=3319 RepID=A0A346LWF4_ABICO|nr:ribosomal protein S15 [Abies concolor]AXQ01099.1 ribosomal protein S15 [Abies concolor]